MNTKIEFEDHGQDFLTWEIDQSGKIVDSKPFQAGIWCKYHVAYVNELKVGGFVDIYKKDDDEGTIMIKYPIASIEKVPDTHPHEA